MYKKVVVFWFLIFLFFVLRAQEEFVEFGKASFYTDNLEGKTTSSGDKYTHTKLTAAHHTLAFGTKVRITNLENNITTVVRINDRIAKNSDSIVKLSKAAATKLNIISKGSAEIKLEMWSKEKDTLPNFTIKEEPKVEDKSHFYSFHSEKISPKGFGVQIGSFKEIANIIEISNNINTEHKDLVIVQVVNVNNAKVYRIIIGSYSAKDEAVKLKAKLSSDFPDCFIISFN